MIATTLVREYNAETALAPRKAVSTCRMRLDTAPKIRKAHRQNESQNRALNQGETHVLRAFGFCDLPMGCAEVSGTCACCGKPFSRFSKVGAQMPYRCNGCTRNPYSKAAANRQAEASEEATLAEALQLSAGGWSARVIAAHLNQHGHSTRRIPCGDWNDANVRTLLRRTIG